MTNKREKIVLDALNAHRKALAELHGAVVGARSQVWYEDGWCYVWQAEKLTDGTISMCGEPLKVRLSQLVALTETLNRRIALQKSE